MGFSFRRSRGMGVQFILRKIIKTVASRCYITRLKCTKFDFGWGSAPDTARGAHNAPQGPSLDFRGPTFKGREWTERERGRGREGKGRKWCGEGKGVKEGRNRRERGRKGKGKTLWICCPQKNFLPTPLPTPRRGYRLHV